MEFQTSHIWKKNRYPKDVHVLNQNEALLSGVEGNRGSCGFNALGLQGPCTTSRRWGTYDSVRSEPMRFSSASRPSTRFFSKLLMPSASRRELCSRLRIMTGLKTFSSKLP